jgi:hypothetical protein
MFHRTLLGQVFPGNTQSIDEGVSEIRRQASDLYWLAFLLTGRRDVSVDIAADVAVAEGAKAFFADWMRAWQRRLVIAKALRAVHAQLVESARRTEVAHVRTPEIPRDWSLSDVTKEALERALLAIELFPRAALLLLVFEHVRIPDAVTLLDADPDLLRKAQVIGLRELTANLAGAKASAVPDSHPGEAPVLMALLDGGWAGERA